MENIAIGCDHAGFMLKEAVKSHLEKLDCRIIDKGAFSTDSVDYPTYASEVAKAVASGEVNYGILVCGTGIGMEISANKVKHVRAANCTNSTMARLCREHNDANVLCLGSRIVGELLAIDIVEAFLKSNFLGNRHARRVELIKKLEE